MRYLRYLSGVAMALGVFQDVFSKHDQGGGPAPRLKSTGVPAMTFPAYHVVSNVVSPPPLGREGGNSLVGNVYLSENFSMPAPFPIRRNARLLSVQYNDTHTENHTCLVIGAGACAHGPEPGQPEIRDPQLAVLGHQHVARFEVSVNDAVVVQELE